MILYMCFPFLLFILFLFCVEFLSYFPTVTGNILTFFRTFLRIWKNIFWNIFWKNIFRCEKKNSSKLIIFGGYSFDVKCSVLSIYEVSSRIWALWKKIQRFCRFVFFSKKNNLELDLHNPFKRPGDAFDTDEKPFVHYAMWTEILT